MAWKSLIPLAGILTLALGGCGAPESAPAATADAAGGPRATATPRERRFEFTYVARVKEVPAGAKLLEVWLPVPTASGVQEVESVEFEAPVEVAIAEESAYGNRIAHLRLEGATLAPCEIAMTARILRRERVRDHELAAGRGEGGSAAERPQARLLQRDQLVPLDGEVGALATGAAPDGAAPLTAAERFYRVVLERMRYSKDGTGWGKGDAVFACREGFGNCSDFHSLFIGMSRAHGIPARFIMGFPLPPERGAGAIGGYHCWAEFFVEGTGWVPVDASEADKHPELADYYFGSLTEDRIAFSFGRDLDLVPRQAGPALNFFIYPYAELDGQPFAAIDKSFAFRDM